MKIVFLSFIILGCSAVSPITKNPCTTECEIENFCFYGEEIYRDKDIICRCIKNNDNFDYYFVKVINAKGFRYTKRISRTEVWSTIHGDVQFFRGRPGSKRPNSKGSRETPK